jgi:uncharacterized protein
MTSQRPAPIPDPLTQPYWTAAKEHRLELPFCNHCSRAHFYPRSLCPHCGSDALAWSRASGRGKIYSYTLVHRAPSPAFAEKVPYAVALVEVEEGPHLMTSIVGCEPTEIRIGAAVVVDFLEVDDYCLPVFRLADRDPSSEKGAKL